MPVHGMNVRECPGKAGKVKTACYVGIFIDVGRVVVVNEVVPERLSKNNPCKHRETDANADRQPAAVHLRRGCWSTSKPRACGDLVVNKVCHCSFLEVS